MTGTAAGDDGVAAGSVVGAIEALAEERKTPGLRARTAVRALLGTATDLLDTLEDHREMGRLLLAELLTAG